MVIGLDFDGTVTLDPPFWRTFIEMAKASNHTVVVATYRNPLSVSLREEVHATVGADTLVVFVRDQWDGGDAIWKEQAIRRAGYEVDVWIDDTPDLIREAWPTR
jgi:hypothetical protein